MEHMNYTYRKKQARLGTLLALLAIIAAVFTNLCKPNLLNAKNKNQRFSEERVMYMVATQELTIYGGKNDRL